MFGKRLRRKLDAIEQRAFAETNDMHKTGFFAPEEDDFLLTWSLGLVLDSPVPVHGPVGLLPRRPVERT